jgi:glycosyl transferase, family 25
MNSKYKTLGFDKVYVINLKRRQDRKTELIKTFPEVDFTFIEAIDGKDLHHTSLIKEKKLNTSFFDPHGMVTKGVFACALSHKKAWDQAIFDGVENALFLEDDVVPNIDFIQNSNLSLEYQNFHNEINQYDWDMIHLGKKTRHQTGMNVGQYLTVPRFNSNHHGAHAYVVKKNTIKYLSDTYLPIKYAADVYLEQLYKTHNVFTTKFSIISQRSDVVDTKDADSDTYYNEYREGAGEIGLSFNQDGNVINKKIAQYIKHPGDILDQYIEIVLTKPKFGKQKFNKEHFFGVSEMLKYISNFLPLNVKMVELYSNCGEFTFYFGCSEQFSNIYSIDPLRGVNKFNIENNLSWHDVKIGFKSNTYHFDNINRIIDEPLKVVNSFNDIYFLFINNKDNKDIKDLIKSYLPKINKEGFIGGDNIKDAPSKSLIFNSIWVIRKSDYKI